MTLRVGLALLVERLQWPVPRVRWEAARQLAALIRSGDRAAHDALLGWTRRQRLEADALITPSLIESFELGDCFSFDELHAAIEAPSVLSDALLASLYPDKASRLFGFRLGYTREASPAPVESGGFERGIGTIVPRIFHTYLKWTERDFELPFLDRWRAEWSLLDREFNETYTDFPSFFVAGDRGVTGSLDVRQRQVFVSAFLRVLAYARAVWHMPDHLALECAELAVPFNAGIARFSTSDRPAWSVGLIEQFETRGAKAFARGVWREAVTAAAAGFEPLALDVMDHGEKAAVRLEIYRAMEERDGGAPHLAQIGDLPWLRPRSHRRSLDGRLAARHSWRDDAGLPPLVIAVQPSALGRAHIDLMPSRLQLPTPLLATGASSIECHEDHIAMTDEAGQLAELRLWYADWAPVHPPEMSNLGHFTTCRSAALREFRATMDVRTPRIVRVHVGRREHRYEPFETNVQSFRL